MRSKSELAGQKDLTFTSSARRAQIVAAAIDTIAAVGYGQASLARIAQGVGISKGVIVYHFDSKEELIEVVVVEVLSKARDYMVPRIEAASGGREKLRTYIDSNIGFMGDYRSHMIAIAEIARGARDAAGNRMFDASSLETGTAALAQLLASFQATGEFRGDFDPRVMAETIRAAIDAVPRRMAGKPDLDVEVYRRELTDLFDLATRSETARTGEATPVTADAPGSGAQAVEVTHLRKAYGETVAVDDVSLSVAEGEIFGILGPNGAGKTTTVECVIGLRFPDAGSIRVMGVDPASDREDLHAIVGAQLQSSALPAKLRVSEIIDLYRSFYRRPADIGELIDALGLADRGHVYYRSLSGGQKQRLSIVLALIGAPRVAVLDEMTAGLDPQARRDTWDMIEGVRDGGVTILLVTHFMEEAQRLCDRVAVVDRGRVVALDSPAGLAARAKGGKLVRFVPSASFDERVLSDLSEVTSVTHEGPRLVVTGTGELVNAVILTLARAGISAHDVELGSSTLEDAFVALTGRQVLERGAPA